MQLNQLKYLIAIVDNYFNISLAAEKIHTSQPAISKQLYLFENELDIKLFKRHGKKLVGLTSIGVDIIKHARQTLDEIENIKRLAMNKKASIEGTFTIATTQTQAKYVLPAVFKQFHQKHPNLRIDTQYDSEQHLNESLESQQIDFAITSDISDLSANMIALPCYHWNRLVIFPKDHPLSQIQKLDLQTISNYPIVTYKEAETNHSSLVTTMKSHNLELNIVFTARDSDIIKNHVQNGMGIGIIADMAFDASIDKTLDYLSVKNVLPQCTTWIVFNKNLLLKNYMYDFISLFAPHITKSQIDQQTGKSISSKKSASKEAVSPLPLHNMWHI